MAIVVAISFFSGCNHVGQRGTGSHLYETVQTKPNRDRDAARRLFDDGLKAMQAGDVQSARDCFQQALDHDVEFGQAHNNLGRLYFTMGKHYLAAWEFEYAAKLMPHRAEPRNNLGLVYQAAGKPGPALEQFELAYEIDNHNPEVIGNLARAKLEMSDLDASGYGLLQELLTYDTRPAWVAWARRTLATSEWNVVSEVSFEDAASRSSGMLPPADWAQPAELLPPTPASNESIEGLTPAPSGSGQLRRFPASL